MGEKDNELKNNGSQTQHKADPQKRSKKDKQRKDYGSYCWVDPRTRKLYAKVQIPTGKFYANGKAKYKTIMKPAKNKTDAAQIAQDELKDHNSRGTAFLDGREMTFKKLADWYKDEYLIEAQYVNGAKVAGMRTWKAERSKLDRLCREFGKILLEDINETVLKRFKLNRFDKDKVGVTAVNRDLELIRSMLRRALKRKWIKEMPDFEELVDGSLEQKRNVTITAEQEQQILTEARGMKNSPRLYALVLTLMDCGARPSEIYPVNDYTTDYKDEEKTYFEPLRWRDVFDEDEQIKDLMVLVSKKGKVRNVRLAVITERMKQAYLDLWLYLKKSRNTSEERGANLDNLIFPGKSYKTAWDIVRINAGVPRLWLRDLRRNFSTRLARLGLSDRLTQRAMGHSNMQQTFDYTEFDQAAALQAKALLDAAISSAARKDE